MESNDKTMYKKGLITGLLISLIIFALCLTGIFFFVYRSSKVLTPKVKSKIDYLITLYTVRTQFIIVQIHILKHIGSVYQFAIKTFLYFSVIVFYFLPFPVCRRQRKVLNGLK